MTLGGMDTFVSDPRGRMIYLRLEQGVCHHQGGGRGSRATAFSLCATQTRRMYEDHITLAILGYIIAVGAGCLAVMKRAKATRGLCLQRLA